MIPPAVFHEVVEQGEGFPVRRNVEAALGEWIRVESVKNQNQEQVEEVCRVGRLDLGEAEVIVLALGLGAQRLLLDDQRAVSQARRLGLTVTRTPVIYAEAKLRGWIPSVREKLEALRRQGFRLKPSDYRLVLAKLGEL